MTIGYNSRLKKASDKTTWFTKWRLQEVHSDQLPDIPLSPETYAVVTELNHLVQVLREQVRHDYQRFRAAELEARKKLKETP